MKKDSGNGEGNPGTGRRRMCFNVEGDGVETTTTTKCVKRRRRDHSAQAAAVTSSSSDQQQQAGEQSALGDQTPSATTVKRSSRFRGVSRHRWTGRYEAHLWDKGTWNPTQRKKGKQVYLGAYDEEESAARAYDLAALKYWGPSTFTNFPVSDYEKELEIMKTITREEYLASLRRRSSGFSRGVSKYRGVARHHHNGRWEARIGRVFGNKYLYLGTYSTQEEAAHAYDIAAIEYRGINAVTNFDLSTYIRWLRPGSNPPDPQESKPGLDPLQPTSPFSTHHNVLMEKPPPTQFSFLQPSPYLTDHDLNAPKKEEDLFQRRPPISPSTKSSASPTALSLLLKSSVFKELVEKNLYTPNEENEEIDGKGLVDAGKSSEVGEFLFSGMSHIPNMFPSSRDTLPLLESKEEESTLPLYNATTEQPPFWNGALNLPPSFH